MIYVPNENYKCYVIQSEGVIRGYEEIPTTNKTINYRDYYINSDYIFRDSSQTFSTYATLPMCLSSSVITNNYFYRVDLYKILIIFTIFAIFCIVLPLKIILRFFRRFQ